MARPKGKKRFPVTITLPRETKKQAAKYAFQRRESLSSLIARLLDECVRQERKAS